MTDIITIFVNMKEETFKRLSWLHRYQYDSLPQNHKNEVKEFRTNHTVVNKLSKRKIKILNELKEINSELTPLKKKQNELYHKVKFINKNFKPTTTITIYSKKNNKDELFKGENRYVQCVVKIRGFSKTIYCGTVSKVKDHLSNMLNNDCSNLREVSVKIELKSIIDKVLPHFIKLEEIEEFTKVKIPIKEIVRTFKSKVSV